MRSIRAILALFWRADRRAFLYGLALSIATLAAGTALLGLSGWFIAACAVAGAAGIGIGFDFFRPSAAVRFLALVRTAARYGERLTTHDATLRFLAALRGRLFLGLAARPAATLGALRRASMLHRLTADVDALDAAYLRLFAPAFSAAAILLLGALLLGWLTTPGVAAWVVGVHGLGGAALLWIGARGGRRASRKGAYALEALRARFIDLARGRVELALSGRLQAQQAAIARADGDAAAARARLDRLDLSLGFLARLAGAAAAAGALTIGAAAEITAPQIAIGVFAALALTEAIAPLARAGLELGRLRLAADRIAGDLDKAAAAEAAPAPARADPGAAKADLIFDGASFRRRPESAPALVSLSLTVRPGEWTTLAGPSGSGKSTALMLAAGLLTPSAGRVAIGGVDLADWPEAALRRRVALLPQRSELFAGTIAENLRLAAPEAADGALVEALEAARLWAALQGRGGLETRLGEGGAGLSGGEARRLALARIWLRPAEIVLLDEPTEGLDAETAAAVLAALKARFAAGAVLTASHREAEFAIADKVLRLGG